MVGKKVAAQPTFDDVIAYINTVKETFHDEPAKYKDFINLVNDLLARKFRFTADQCRLHARGGQLFKDHPNLVAGLNAFLPVKYQIFFPPEPDQSTELPENTESEQSTELSDNIESEQSAELPENTEPEQSTELPDNTESEQSTELSDNIESEQSAELPENTEPEQSTELPDNTESEQSTELSDNIESEQSAELPENTEPEQSSELPDNTQPEKPTELREDGEDLLNKIKARFQRLDTHVPNSFGKIMKDFKEGKKSGKEVREEVLDLLYYHEDLRGEFLRLLQ